MIYLDNNATTEPLADVSARAIAEYHKFFANPSSSHVAGLDARDAVERARQHVADWFRCRTSGVVFTSGATEANAIILNSFDTKICSAVEHKSILDGSQIIIPVRSDGMADIDLLEKSLRVQESVPLVSVMLSNNETGFYPDPLLSIKQLKQKYSFAYHIDACHGILDSDFDPHSTGADFLTISGHKIHAFKGIGAIIDLSGAFELSALFGGGPQEWNIRPGTENTLGIYSLGLVAEKIIHDKDFQKQLGRVPNVRDYLEELLVSRGLGEPNHGTKRNAKTSNFWLHEITDLNLFLYELSCRGVYCSGMSACSSGLPELSHVLSAMYGYDNDRSAKSVRFSVSHLTSEVDIDKAVDIISSVIKNRR